MLGGVRSVALYITSHEHEEEVHFYKHKKFRSNIDLSTDVEFLNFDLELNIDQYTHITKSQVQADPIAAPVSSFDFHLS